MGTYAVILAGGSGTRLWPRSRSSRPKHLLSLVPGQRELLRETYDRIHPMVDRVLVVTEAAQSEAIHAILPELTDEDLIAEPAARGTTNALALAALTLLKRDPDSVMVSVPADHLVRDVLKFQSTVSRALEVATASDQLVTMGLRPTYAATGLGYILAGAVLQTGSTTAMRVARFVEKPDRETAETYLADGRYYWNLALFCWRTSAFISELERLAPLHHQGVQAVVDLMTDGHAEHAAERYAELPNQAVDYAVMEKTDRLLLVPALFDWVDVGSWPELLAILPHDPSGNSVAGRHLLIDTESCLFDVPGKLVAAIGMRDVVVIDTPDALLICARDRAQDVKQVVDGLRRMQMAEYV
ncbi:MAG TPA: sugar phosphate nucleotidyltransferase [Candidatus Dormibacteraeota bacterium]|jgi:mannose-1-phosphate guanylyltransferase